MKVCAQTLSAAEAGLNLSAVNRVSVESAARRIHVQVGGVTIMKEQRVRVQKKKANRALRSATILPDTLLFRTLESRVVNDHP